MLRTKLFIPPIPPDTILRPHLVECLNRGLLGKLSLVIAPAGYGKTTLVTTWLNRLTDIGPQAVWLSLDASDNDVRRFFTYFVAALCQLDESFVAIQDEFMQDSRGELSTTAIVTSLLNQLVAYGQPTVLILDDYHEIEDQSIHGALSFWLDHQPFNFHLVITSRVEPPLPLARMRVRRQVTEIDTEALRFSRNESADFLNQHMHLNLSADDIDQLDLITEGWVASLQLAALSLQNKDDPTEFIQTFKGDNRYIVDYLVTEVLHRQPGYIRDFLLQTSILERLNVQLCNAVTEQVGSQHILETLDQARLFVIPLDDRRHWYRYHHLFADCLRAELHHTLPDDVLTFHERASQWFSNNGFLGEAIHHAFAAGNKSLAAELIATNARTMLWELGDYHRLWQWVQQLPDDELRASPQLLIATAWLHQELFLECNAHIDELLDDASNLIRASHAPYRSAEIVEMATEIALSHANLERLRGNLESAIEHSERALTLIQSEDSSFFKIATLHSLALSHHRMGNIRQSLNYSAAQFEQQKWTQPLDYAQLVSLAYRIDALRLAGQLEQAAHVYRRAAPTLSQQLRADKAMFVVNWAEVLRERNQLAEAADSLLPAIEALKPLQSMAAIVQTAVITLARIRQAQSQPQEALQLLEEASQWYPDTDVYYPSARVLAYMALLHLQQGNLVATKAWAEKSGLHVEDEPTYLLEIDYLVLARLLIADGMAGAAQLLLEKLEKAATNGGRVARLIEITILQALAYQALGAPELALSHLGKAIEFAQPAGFIRVFVDEGPALIPLFRQMAGRGVAVSYIRELLLLLDKKPQPQPPQISPLTAGQNESDNLNLLLNPLTDRELATLRYLASDLSIPKIAEQMVVAPSTIRTYVKRIYSKLDVHNRIEAVNRARALDLIA